MPTRDRTQVTEISLRVGGNVRRLREQLGITQVRLGKEAGMSRSSLWMLEQGRHVTTVEQLVRLAEVLETTPSALLGDAPSGPQALTRESVVKAAIQDLKVATARLDMLYRVGA